MKTLGLLLLGLTVALATPPFADVEQNPVLTKVKVKAEPEVKVVPQVKVGPQVKAEPEIKVVPEVKAEPEIKVVPEVKAEPEIEVVPEVKAEPEIKVVQEVKAEPEIKVVQEVKAEPEVSQPLPIKVEPEVKAESEVKVVPEVNVGPKVKVEQEAKVEPEVPKPLQEEGMGQDQPLPDAAFIEEEGPALDFMGREMPPVEEYFPNEEARIRMVLNTLTEESSDYLINEEPWSKFVGEEEPLPVASLQFFEGQEMEDSLLDVDVENENTALMRKGVENPVEGGLSSTEDKQATRRRRCLGILSQEKCYQFFKGPKRAVDAELFCQTFPGGHLASITNPDLQRSVIRMMWKNRSYSTLIGGIRFLKTGHFIWLDGSRWSYANWGPGEPNNSANLEDCVVLVRSGNGIIRDFTCGEPQSFFCSYTFN